jgi:hypothetical protein
MEYVPYLSLVHLYNPSRARVIRPNSLLLSNVLDP